MNQNLWNVEIIVNREVKEKTEMPLEVLKETLSQTFGKKHPFVSALSNGIKKQDKLEIIEFGDQNAHFRLTRKTG